MLLLERQLTVAIGDYVYTVIESFMDDNRYYSLISMCTDGKSNQMRFKIAYKDKL